MKRIVLLSIFAGIFLLSSAQQTMIYTNPDALLSQGKELFIQGKYTASFRALEEFLSTASSTQESQKLEADYYLAANAFYMGSDDALTRLNKHLTVYPYTNFLSQVNLMLGILAYNNSDFKKVLNYFIDVDTKDLDKRQQVDYMFYKGCALLEQKDYTPALVIFRDLKSMETRYNISAIYYYAYTEYSLKNYDAALVDFLKIEDNPQYKNIVPYYVVQIYYAQKDYDKLKYRASRILEENPGNKNNAEIYRILGEIAYEEKNYAQAITNLKKYEELFPQVLRNDMYLLGLSYFYTGDYKNAVQYLSKVTVEKDEITENAYLHLGNCYVKMDDKANARMAYEASLRTNFNQSVREEALFNYALTSYETTSAFGESVKAFEQFLFEFPLSKHADEAYDYLSSVYMTTKNYQAAYESIQRIKNPNAKMLETKQYLLYQLGTEAFAQNKINEALEYFSLSLNSSSTGAYSAECYFWRAECYYRQNQPEKSLADLKAFFANSHSKSSVNHIAAYYSAGYASFAQKNYSEALRYFSNYISSQKDKNSTYYIDALNRVGDCYFIERSFAKAEDYYSRAVNASPNTSDYPMFQSAYIDGLKKDYSEKIKKMERLIGTYPNSEYVDDALYEMGRAYLMLENNNNAIVTYQRLIKQFPNADLARKAALEIGMIYYNMSNEAKAIEAYKNVIQTYTGSEEAYTALESLESLYVEKNDVNSYLQYTQTLGPNMGKRTVSHADSISYIAAEKRYMNGNYADAIRGMRDYLNKYCPGGRYCTTARYYLSDSYYQTNEKEDALASFKELLRLGVNQYTEEAIMRCAELTFDNKDYKLSLAYFQQLQTAASTSANKDVARLGILRCSYFANDYETTIKIVNEIMHDSQASEQVKSEARYNRAKAYLAQGQQEKALEDLKAIAEDTRTTSGAEAKYLIAEIYFKQDKLAAAEDEIVDFTKKNTPHQYWLARSLVLLADVNVKLGDDFQAKQYLLSLQRNYTANDEILELINERLSAINDRETQKLAQ